jgi:hypothetical protein
MRKDFCRIKRFVDHIGFLTIFGILSFCLVASATATRESGSSDAMPVMSYANETTTSRPGKMQVTNGVLATSATIANPTQTTYTSNSQALSAGALAYVPAVTTGKKLVYATITANTAINETPAVYLNGVLAPGCSGTAQTSMTAYTFVPVADTILSGNNLSMNCTNANTTGAVVATVVVE